MSKRFTPFADKGITREEVLGWLRQSGDPKLVKYAESLATKPNWDPDNLFKLLAKALGRDPKEDLK